MGREIFGVQECEQHKHSLRVVLPFPPLWLGTCPSTLAPTEVPPRGKATCTTGTSPSSPAVPERWAGIPAAC